MSPLDMDCGLLKSFVAMFDTTTLKARFNYFAIYVVSLLEWVETAAALTEKENKNIIEVEVSQRRFALIYFQFLTSGNLPLQNFGAERLSPVAGTFLASACMQ